MSSIDWKALCYAADPDMKRPIPTYRLGKGRQRLFYNTDDPYQNYEYGIGYEELERTFIVAPDLSGQDLLNWIKNEREAIIDGLD